MSRSLKPSYVLGTTSRSGFTTARVFGRNNRTLRMGRTFCASAAATRSSLQDKIQEWMSLDRDPASRAVIEDLVAKQANVQLEELMCKRLEFGKQLGEARSSSSMHQLLIHWQLLLCLICKFM